MSDRKRSGRRQRPVDAVDQSKAEGSAQQPEKTKRSAPAKRPRRKPSSGPEIISFWWSEVESDRPARQRRAPRDKPSGKASGKPAAEPPKKETPAAAEKPQPRAAKAGSKPPTAEQPPASSAQRKRPRRRKRTAKPAAEPAAAEPNVAATAKSATKPSAEPTAEPVAQPAAEAASSPPKRKRRPRHKKKTTAAGVSESTSAATPEAKVDAPPPATSELPEEVKPTARKRSADSSAEGFAAMGLSDAMLDSLDRAGYLEPTPIQAGLIPRALDGDDLMGQAQTGTGKTAAFAIPILERLESIAKPRGPQALVLVPTRELAVQVRDEVTKLASGQKARIVAVYGGKPIRGQMEKLQRGVEVVVGTPGRVMDHMSRGTLFLGDLRQVVLDEADRMLDIGFRPDIEKILRHCPQSRQTLLLSATLPAPVLRLAQRYMRDPESLDFSAKDVAVETIEQSYFTVDPTQKFELLVKLLEREKPTQAIIFCRTRRGTERIQQRLVKKHPGTACIHGDLPQRTRDRVMEGFRAGKIRLLVATDVMGRGIDVSSISHIINFDIPEFCDDYVHRVGRTGRMGREGVAFSFVTPEEGPELTRIEMRINHLLQRDEIPGFVATAKHQPVPAAAAEATTEAQPPKPEPVFGRRTRKIRRAL